MKKMILFPFCSFASLLSHWFVSQLYSLFVRELIYFQVAESRITVVLIVKEQFCQTLSTVLLEFRDAKVQRQL